MAARARSYTVTEVEASAGAALRHVRGGETVAITARGQVVARLVPAVDDPVLEAEGRFKLPTRTVTLQGEGLASDVVIEDRR